MVTTLSEIRFLLFLGANHESSKEYMERVRQATLADYDELTEDCKKIPETRKAMKMI